MARSRLIIVGIDFTQGSFAALDQAAALAEAWGVPLCCAHVIDELDLGDLAIAMDRPLEALFDKAREDAMQSLAAALAPLSATVGLVTDVMLGQPHKSLSELVRTANSQLLIIGARGHEEEPGVGSTALACVREASADVLVVSDDNAHCYRRVLACTGLGPESVEVVTRAAEMVSSGGTLDVLHIMAPPGQRLLASGRERFEQWARKGLSRTVSQVENLCESRQIDVNEIVVMGRQIPATIVRTASERQCDLVVVGKRSRSAMANTLLGSIAMTVITSSECSVLAVNTLVGEGDEASFDEDNA
jgi:nucleotide-binding universal stress UspA family protein